MIMSTQMSPAKSASQLMAKKQILTHHINLMANI